jgi:hypothetical protein
VGITLFLVLKSDLLGVGVGPRHWRKDEGSHWPRQWGRTVICVVDEEMIRTRRLCKAVVKDLSQ